MGNVATGSEFLLNRGNLLDSIGSAATVTMGTYDKNREAGKLSNEVRQFTNVRPFRLSLLHRKFLPAVCFLRLLSPPL